MTSESRLKYFPISFFAIIMGLIGLYLVLEKAAVILNFESGPLVFLLYFIVLLFLVLTIAYIIKMILYFEAVRKELAHPIRLSFFPAFSISIILFSIAFLDINETLSKYLFVIGVTLHFLATIYILSQWVRQTKFEIGHFNPGWFIPVVGNILIPISGIYLFSPELSWFFYSIGIVFWMILFTIFIYRVVFHHPMPSKLIPTFFILIAPPAIGFISYVKLTGSIDSFSKILYYMGLFLLIFLAAQFKMFAAVKFYLSSWAYSFPVAAISLATALMYQQTGLAFFNTLFFCLLALLTIFVVLLAIYTIKAAVKGEICVKED